jgi:NAD(P)-dependent dehydrogenase (short-subunit alcohol dehydrogenase family)
MAGQTVLVTGGTAGIGKATALGLAAMGAHLAITGRDRARTEDAAREIRAAGGGQVNVFVADLSSQAQVRRLAGEVLRSLSGIDVLINNVGGYWNTRHVTADGLERTFALNHLAPFLLTSLLLGRLKDSAPARVITVSSNMQAVGRIDFDDLQGERSCSGARAYNQSKLANVLFTYELARNLQGTSVTANALHPGVVRTSFGAEDPGGGARRRQLRHCRPRWHCLPRPVDGRPWPVERRLPRGLPARLQRAAPAGRVPDQGPAARGGPVTVVPDCRAGRPLSPARAERGALLCLGARGRRRRPLGPAPPPGQPDRPARDRIRRSPL